MALVSSSYNFFITSSSLECISAYMIIHEATEFPWNVFISILSKCDIISHSEFIHILFNIISIPHIDAP